MHYNGIVTVYIANVMATNGGVLRNNANVIIHIGIVAGYFGAVGDDWVLVGIFYCKTLRGLKLGERIH